MKTENICQKQLPAPIKVLFLAFIVHLSFSALKNLILSNSTGLFLFSTIGFFTLGFITVFISVILKSKFVKLSFFKIFALTNTFITAIMTAFAVYDYKFDNLQLLPGFAGGLIINFTVIPAVIFLISDFIIWLQYKFALKRKCSNDR